MFDDLYENIKDYDHIYIEHTGGLRAISTIILSMINYVRETNKNVVFEDIYCTQVLGDNVKDATLYSIKNLVMLNDWAIGVQNYVKYGDVSSLEELVQSDNDVKSKLLVEALADFSNSMSLCLIEDAKEYYSNVVKYKEDFFNSLNTVQIKNNDASKIEKLRQILDSKFKYFEKYPLYAAIKWNYDHHNYQQVFTIIYDHVPHLLFDYNVVLNKTKGKIDSLKNIIKCIDKNALFYHHNKTFYYDVRLYEMRNRIWDIIKNKYLEDINYECLSKVISFKIKKEKYDKELMLLIQSIFDEYEDINDIHKDLNIIIGKYSNSYLNTWLNKKKEFIIANCLKGEDIHFNKDFHYITGIKKDELEEKIPEIYRDQYDLILKMYLTQKVYDKNAQDISEYESKFKDNTKLFSDIPKETLEISNNYIKYSDEIEENLKLINNIRKIRNDINHAQTINSDKFKYVNYVKSEEYKQSIEKVCQFIIDIYDGKYSD